MIYRSLPFLFMFLISYKLYYQATIRRLLLASVDDPHKKICTAVSVAVASVAHYDWPEDWPDLLPFLLKLMNEQNNVNAGMVRTTCIK